MNQKVLVTGGAGFIGSHLIKQLLDEGYSVVNVDNVNDYYDPEIKRSRLAQFQDRIEHVEIDIADRSALEAVFQKHSFDKICHLAAQAGVRYSLENPYIYADSNYVGTVNIFELAKRYGVKDIVMASTSSVYGANTKMPFSEEDRVDTPMSIYAASKRACELLAYSYNHLFNLNITCLRFFTVYGPWGRPDMALFLFTKAMLHDEPIKVFNKGEMKRDFTYVADIVQGFVKAVKKPNGYAIYNLGNGSPVGLMEFIHEIERVLGKKAILDYQPMQPGDVPETYADISKARKELGYEPQFSVSQGVPEFVKWYREFYSL